MGKGLVSLMFTAGVCAWVYARFMRTTGNDTGRSLMAVGILGVVLFVVSFFILGAIL